MDNVGGDMQWLKLQRCEKEKTSSLSLLHYITLHYNVGCCCFFPTIYVLLFGGVGVNISFEEEKSISLSLIPLYKTLLIDMFFTLPC